MADLGPYLTSINKTKINIMREGDEAAAMISGYPAYIINKLLSYHEDCILIVNELNKLPQLDNQLQFDYLLNMVSKKNRFAKLHKEINHEHLALVKKYYGYSTNKAVEVLEFHTEKDFEYMQSQFFEGGTINNNKTKKNSNNNKK